MKKRTALIGAILSLIPLGQPLIIKTGVVLSTTGLILSVPEKAQAENYSISAIEYVISAKNYYEEGNFEKALEDLNKAILIYPQDYYSYYLRSYVKNKLNDPYGEISDLNKAIKRNKLNFELYVNRGLTKQEIGDIKGACSDWRKASSLGYKEARVWVEEEC